MNGVPAAAGDAGRAEWQNIVTRLEAVRRLARRVGHDVNNYAATILMTCELLATDLAKGTPRPDDIQEIRNQARQLADFARELARFAAAVEAPADPPMVALNELVMRCLPTIRGELDPAIDIVTALPDALPSVRADPSHVEGILKGLVADAGAAMRGGGRLTIGASGAVLSGADAPSSVGRDRFAGLLVCHTGEGPSRAARECLFEPFAADPRHGPKPGIGLAAVYRLVRACNGWVQVSSEPEDGTTTFVTYFPVAAVSPGGAPADSRGSGGGHDPAG